MAYNVGFELECIGGGTGGPGGVPVADEGSFVIEYSSQPITAFRLAGTIAITRDIGDGPECTSGELTWTAQRPVAPVVRTTPTHLPPGSMVRRRSRSWRATGTNR